MGSKAHELNVPAARVRRAFVIGFICAFVSPTFLWCYYAYHGVSLGIRDSIAFFGGVYFAPAVIGAGVGVLLARALASLFPLIDATISIVVSATLIVTFFVGLVLALLADRLNFAVYLFGFEFPAFAAGHVVIVTLGTLLASISKRTAGNHAIDWRPRAAQS